MKRILFFAVSVTVFQSCNFRQPVDPSAKEGFTTDVSDGQRPKVIEIRKADIDRGKEYGGEYHGYISKLSSAFKAQLTLQTDGTFTLLEIPVRAAVNKVQSRGFWVVAPNGDIELTENNINVYKRYRPEGKQLRLLDTDDDLRKERNPFVLKRIR